MTAIYSTTVFLEKVTWSETEIDAEQMILWETTNSDQSEVLPWTYKKGQRQQYHPPCMRSLSDSNDHAPGLNSFLFSSPPPPPPLFPFVHSSQYANFELQFPSIITNGSQTHMAQWFIQAFVYHLSMCFIKNKGKKPRNNNQTAQSCLLIFVF